VPIKQEEEEEEEVVVLAQLGEGVGSEEEVDDDGDEVLVREIIPEPEPKPVSGGPESTSIEVPGRKKEGERVDPSQSQPNIKLLIE